MNKISGSVYGLTPEERKEVMKIKSYFCPECKSEMTYLHSETKPEMYCVKCRTSIILFSNYGKPKSKQLRFDFDI